MPEKDPARRYASAADLANDLGRFLEGKAVAAVPVSPVERLARLAARDGYQIVGEIGRGPRSIVYRAHYGALPQPVALKVFSAGAGTQAEWEARLRRDSGSWATLAHPHIVPVQRTGWWDGAPYLSGITRLNRHYGNLRVLVNQCIEVSSPFRGVSCYGGKNYHECERLRLSPEKKYALFASLYRKPPSEASCLLCSVIEVIRKTPAASDLSIFFATVLPRVLCLLK